MEKKTYLERYKDKDKQLAYLRDYNNKNYKKYLLSFNYEKDADLIEALDNAKSKAELIREMYKKYKG